MGRPVAGASAFVDHAIIPGTATDARGHFSFSRVPIGKNQLTLQGREGNPLANRDGHEPNLRVALRKGVQPSYVAQEGPE